jgi:DNA modification methylase
LPPLEVDIASIPAEARRFFRVTLKPKDLCGIPWRVAFALQADGWYLRSDIIWSKPNPMPESATDRPTKSHEYVFLLAKSERYFYDVLAIAEPSVTQDIRRPYTSQGAWELDGRPAEQRHGGEPRSAVREPAGWATEDAQGRGGKSAFRGQGSNRDSENGPANREGREMRDVGVGLTRNKRTVWTIATQAFPEAHFATFPEELAATCIKAGTSERGCCLKCGAPWERVIQTQEIAAHGLRSPNLSRDETGLDRGQDWNTRRTFSGCSIGQTTGWQPTCECDACDPVPCTVLDPFAGSGTVGKVAFLLGRRFVCLDLKWEYCKMAQRRVPPMGVR